MKCRKCDVELFDGNWDKIYGHVCKSCRRTYNKECKKQIKLNNPDYDKNYWNKNKERINRDRREDSKEHREKTNKQRREWYCLNRNRELQKSRRRNIIDKDKIKEQKKRYRKEHIIDIRYYMYLYRSTPSGMTATKKCANKHSRELGFNPLNTSFEECSAHHINLIDVIYIPLQWNQSIYHNVHNGKNMEAINTMAFFFLLMQNIKEIKNTIISSTNQTQHF